jgi:hypothetical protein
MRDEQRIATVDEQEGIPFLSRWSRRKLGREVDDPQGVEPVEQQVTAAVQAEGETAAAVDDDPIDPRTGKRRSELSDEDMPELESLTVDSDVSMFFGGKVSPALRMQALSKIFSNPKYNVWCVCAEYAEDYTNFTPMGDIVPHDLKSAIAREAGKLYQRLTAKGLQLTPEQAEAHIAAEMRSESVPDLELKLAAEQGVDLNQQGDADHGMSAAATDETIARGVPPASNEAL